MTALVALSLAAHALVWPLWWGSTRSMVAVRLGPAGDGWCGVGLFYGKVGWLDIHYTPGQAPTEDSRFVVTPPLNLSDLARQLMMNRGARPAEWWGVTYGYGAINAGAPPSTVVGVPFWALAVLTAIPPVAWFVRSPARRRRRRLAQGLCARCGYDLRATPGRCPECGADPGPMAAQPAPLPAAISGP